VGRAFRLLIGGLMLAMPVLLLFAEALADVSWLL
jgi:hypothetical protein